MITVTKVNKWFGKLHVLKDVSFNVAQGRGNRYLRSERFGQEHPHPLH